MADRGFMAGTQTGTTIWHEASSAQSAGAHKILLALFNGQVEFANGEQGTYAGVETITLDERAEPFSGTHTFLLADGSASNQTFEGTVTRRDAPDRVAGVGIWKIASGTGRLKNLTGGGVFSWSIDGDRYFAKFDTQD